ncbi:DUF6694 family lipoprotein [Microbulbifer sp. JSM ZJ756]|uniref:DUF6694 family lipoprotein n=1 Tax=Microbulbifer sp. JSM ZJ756 TaxID=3376191 RepID=UPI0037A17ECA
MKIWVIGLLLAVALVGCGEPRLDGSSKEAFEASVQEVAEALPQSQQEKFAGAVIKLMMNGKDIFELAAAGETGAELMASEMRSKLDGKTAAEVLEMAAELDRQRKAREREQALGEIRELEDSMAAAEAAKEQLEQFEVLKSRYYEEKSRWTTNEVIELTVRNGTGQPVSRAYFEGTLASPERSIPWAVDQFNYQIPGGLEPDEEATWRLNAAYFDFANAGAPEDAVFTVVVQQVDGADGEPLASSRGFDEDDRKRLAELKASYGSGEG